MGEIGVQQVNEFEICCIGHLVNDTLERLCNSGPGRHEDWFKGGCYTWMPCCSVFCISMKWRGTELCLRNGYHSHTSPIIPGKLFCTIFTHSVRVFPDRIDSGNPITTFAVRILNIIAAATEVKVFPIPISSTTSAPGISASQTHLLTMNQIAQTWWARNLVPGRPGIQYWWPGTRSSVDWRIRWALSSLTAFSRH